jgi:hypothetical protein
VRADLNGLLKVIENFGDVEFLDAGQLARVKPIKAFLNGIARLETFAARAPSLRMIVPAGEAEDPSLDQSAGGEPPPPLSTLHRSDTYQGPR